MRVGSKDIIVGECDVDLCFPLVRLQGIQEISHLQQELTLHTSVRISHLKLTSPAKPPTILFLLENGVLSAIFRRNMEEVRIKEVFPSQFYQGRTVDATVLIQKSHVHVTPVRVQVFRCLSKYIMTYGGQSLSTTTRILYDCVYDNLEDLLTRGETLCVHA